MEAKNSSGAVLRLLKKSRRGIFSAVFSRFGIMTLMLLAQVALLVLVFVRFRAYWPHYYIAATVFSVAMVLWLLSSSIDPTAKITWLLLIMLAPAFGTMMFFYTRSDLGHRALKKRLGRSDRAARGELRQDPAVLQALELEDPGAAALSRYIASSGNFPLYSGCQLQYFPLGEQLFPELLRQLEGAKEYIYLEYFIVEEGVMWGSILEVLSRKVAEGVDVRMLYDGTCEFALLPRDYPRRLQKLGVKCRVFSPITPFVSTHYNYRDHRKILVVDGHTAFTGGINLADEYINLAPRYGVWKDTAVMVKGEAARSFALMFLEMWNLTEKKVEYPRLTRPWEGGAGGDGFLQPYADSPLDSRKVGEMVYMDLLNRARRSVHIMTPYLILDGELETALKFAAERGVEVSLLLPGIPDKKGPYALALTHYPSLMASGVKIYEYTPGFVHSKVFVMDGREAVVGTINLDYRSLYHHFECAVYMVNQPIIEDIEQDFAACVRQSRLIDRQAMRRQPFARAALGVVMKTVAPLM